MKGFKKLSMLVCVLAMLLCMAGVAMAEDYHAYIGIQGNKYTFRNGWTEGNYGLEGSQLPEGYDYLSSGLIGWAGEDNSVATIFPATVKNATISGNGTFEASLEDIQWNGDSKLNYLVLYTDMPISSDRLEYLDGIVTHLIVEIDGEQVWEIDAQDQESDAEYGLWSIDEIWDSGDYAAYKIINGDTNPFDYTSVPESVRVVFTVEGMENDAPAEDQVAEPTEEPTEAPTEAPTEEPTEAPTEAAGDDNKDDNASAEPTTAPTQAPSSSDSSDNADDGGNMGLIIGIIVAVVVVVVIIVVVATKKKK